MLQGCVDERLGFGELQSSISSQDNRLRSLDQDWRPASPLSSPFVHFKNNKNFQICTKFITRCFLINSGVSLAMYFAIGFSIKFPSVIENDTYSLLGFTVDFYLP